MTKICFVHVGRLCKEKGSDLILDFFNSLDATLLPLVCLDIYGDGVLRKVFEELSQKMDNVTYHGYTSKEIILENWKNADYTLMPSRFLETFGLSALDSFGMGVPVVGFRKGGLEQFGECVIDVGDEKNFSTSLLSLIQKHTSTDGDILSKKCLLEFEKYNKKLWLQRYRQLVGGELKGKKILIASDYIVKLGGIETYILDVKNLLEEQGTEVRLMGSKTIRYGWKRYVAMIFSFLNIPFALNIKKEVDDRMPDIIRWHSVHRRIGWFPLRVMRNFSGKQAVMYHDFGLFHPVPSDVYDEEQLGYSKSLRGYMGASKKTGFSFLLRMSLLCIKWWSSNIIWKFLRRTSLHLVPSAYMEKRVTRMGIEEERVKTLPHFV